MLRRTHVGAALVAAGVLVAGCSGGGSASSAGSGSGAPVTIKAVLPPNTGPITAADNAGLKQLTTAVRGRAQERHRPVAAEQHVEHHPVQRPAGEPGLRRQRARNVVWEQYGPVTSGAIPAGPAAEHQAVPDQAQPVRAGQLQLAVAVPVLGRPVHDLAERRHRHPARVQRRDRLLLQQGRLRQGRDLRHRPPAGPTS